MEKVPAETMREFVRSQNFTSTEDIMAATKDMFKDVLQQVMECELADELGYEKSERIFSSIPSTLRLSLPIILGSYSPFLSLGTLISSSPICVFIVFFE